MTAIFKICSDLDPKTHAFKVFKPLAPAARLRDDVSLSRASALLNHTELLMVHPAFAPSNAQSRVRLAPVCSGT